MLHNTQLRHCLRASHPPFYANRIIVRYLHRQIVSSTQSRFSSRNLSYPCSRSISTGLIYVSSKPIDLYPDAPATKAIKDVIEKAAGQLQIYDVIRSSTQTRPRGLVLCLIDDFENTKKQMDQLQPLPPQTTELIDAENEAEAYDEPPTLEDGPEATNTDIPEVPPEPEYTYIKCYETVLTPDPQYPDRLPTASLVEGQVKVALKDLPSKNTSDYAREHGLLRHSAKSDLIEAPKDLTETPSEIQYDAIDPKPSRTVDSQPIGVGAADEDDEDEDLEYFTFDSDAITAWIKADQEECSTGAKPSLYKSHGISSEDSEGSNLTKNSESSK